MLLHIWKDISLRIFFYLYSPCLLLFAKNTFCVQLTVNKQIKFTKQLFGLDSKQNNENIIHTSYFCFNVFFHTIYWPIIAPRKLFLVVLAYSTQMVLYRGHFSNFPESSLKLREVKWTGKYTENEFLLVFEKAFLSRYFV